MKKAAVHGKRSYSLDHLSIFHIEDFCAFDVDGKFRITNWTYDLDTN